MEKEVNPMTDISAFPRRVALLILSVLVVLGSSSLCRANRGQLGVRVADVGPDDAKTLGVNAGAGAIVVEVVPDGPAAKAGIARGDVIQEFNGQQVTGSKDLSARASQAAAGTTVHLKIIRNRQTRDVVVTIGEFSEASSVAAPAQPQDPNASSQQVQHEVRFAVAHAHVSSWCLGYLYVSADSIRYEVMKPEKDKKHGFTVSRSEIAVQQWMRLGQLENAIEIKTLHGSYHFWWVPNEEDLQPGRPALFNPSVAAAPDTLIATLKDPSAVLGGTAAAPAEATAASGQPVSAPAQANVSGAQIPSAPTALAASTASASNPADASGSSDLVGSWMCQKPSTISLILNADGSGALNSKNIRWQFSAGILSLISTTGTGTTNYHAALANGLLVVSGGDLPDARIFQRQPVSTSQGSVSQQGPEATGVANQTGSASPVPDASDSGGAVLADGTPPLTKDLVNREAQFYEWLLDAQLTTEQRSELQEALIGKWNSHRQDHINTDLKVMNQWDGLKKLSPEDQDVTREKLRALYLDMIRQASRQTPNFKWGQWVLNVYDSAHRPIANGDPPLTRQVADAYAELISFMVSECLHQAAFQANRQFKDQLAQSLATTWSAYPPQAQRSLSQLPATWKAVRYNWPRISEPQRETYRKEWATVLLGLASGTQNATATTGATGNSSLQNYMNNYSEKLFVNSVANSSFATTMSLHLNMWH
jgi:PDZ domain